MTDDIEYLERMNSYLARQIDKIKPPTFYGEKDVRVIARKNFEEMITSLEEVHIANARVMTTFQLYTKIDYFEKKANRLKQELQSNGGKK